MSIEGFYINNYLGSPFVTLIIPIFVMIINFNHKHKCYFKLKATYAANTKNISIPDIFVAQGVRWQITFKIC